MTMETSIRLCPILLLVPIMIAGACTSEREESMPAPLAESPSARPGSVADDAFSTAEDTTRFLTQATFGPRPNEVASLTGGSAAQWFRDQLAISPSHITPRVLEERAKLGTPQEDGEAFGESVTLGFWQNASSGPDQLRQRMAWALSQILVVSNAPTELLADIPETLSYYQDLLIDGAFDSYRDLLTEVSYSPAMAYYLTYLGSEKANPATGRMPDENYARELMQLFTIGVAEMGLDGQPRPRAGQAETYDNRDVSGLARVFTGLGLVNPVSDEPWGAFPASFRTRLVFDEVKHSPEAKSFLGTTIAANTPGPESLRLALDALFAHPNVAPFVGRQLIQRFVTSAPSPAYVARVARSFERGRFTLPDRSEIGSGARGDLGATLAAILFDEEARRPLPPQAPSFGKIREPILRVTAWVRAFGVEEITPLYLLFIYDTSGPRRLMQHPYRAPSVFNFFRPGYLAPGTMTGRAGLTTPELQIVNASTIPGYGNFMYRLVTRRPDRLGEGETEDLSLRGLSVDSARRSFMPNYTEELALALDPSRLVEHLDRKLTYGTMSEKTKGRIAQTLQRLPPDNPERRVHLAIWMAMTSPDFLVQK